MKKKLSLYSLLFLLITLNKGTLLFGQNQAQESERAAKYTVDESKFLWENEPFGTYAQGSEIIQKRDATTKHFRNPDGTITAHVSSGKINYFENGQWKTIFHSIVPSSTGFENTTNNHKTYYPSTSAGNIKTTLANGATLIDLKNLKMYYEVNGNPVQTQNIQEKQGMVNYNELTYSNVYGVGIDLRLTQNTTQRKMDYIINSPAALINIPSGAQFLVFEEQVVLPNAWTAQLVNNEILLIDPTNTVQVIYEKPIFSDTPQHHHHDGNCNHSPSQNSGKSMHRKEGISELIQVGNTLTIKTKVSITWLTAPERSYPIIIDPTANFTPNNATAWTGSLQSWTGYAGTNTIRDNDFIAVGKFDDGDDDVLSGWAKFNIGGIPDGSCVSSAALWYKVYYNATTQSSCVTQVRTRHMANDPVPATNATILTDIRDGAIYSNADWAIKQVNAEGGTNFWYTKSLNANSELQASLAVDWFGVGLEMYNHTGGHADCWIEIRGYSNADRIYLRVTYNPPPTDPGFGNFMWNVAGHNGNNIDLTGTTYYGYYTQNTGSTTDFGFNTQDMANSGWANTVSPSSSPTWSGCILPNDNFTFVHKRRGFPCGTYQLTLNNWDDATRVYINGNPTPVWSCPDWNGAGTCTGGIGVYALDPNSTIEVRTAEGAGGANASLSITPVVSTLALSGDSRTCPVSGDQWVHFYTGSDGRYLASVRGTSPASNLGNVTVTAYDDVNPLNVPACNDPGYITSVMERHWVITPTVDGAAEVRLPYYGEELSQLTTVANANSNPDDNVSGQASVRLSKYSGGVFPASVNVNSSPFDNCPALGGVAGMTTIHNNSGVGTVAGVTIPGGEASALYSQYTIPGFSEFWLHGMNPTSPLAVNLSSFTTHCEENTVRIRWTTASEQNSDYFTLERSRDGYNWDAIATIDGAGTTNSTTNYEVIDNAATEVYYRLIQTDFDGTSELFGPVMSNCTSSANELKIYPNPTNGVFTVALIASESIGDATIRIQDVSGKIVADRTVSVLSGTNNVSFEEKHLARGTYIVSVQVKDKNIYTPVRLVIQ